MQVSIHPISMTLTQVAATGKKETEMLFYPAHYSNVNYEKNYTITFLVYISNITPVMEAINSG